MRKISLIGACLLLLASAGLVMAGSGGQGQGKGYGSAHSPMGKGPGKLMAQAHRGSHLSCLNLSSEQSEKIAALREVHIKEITPLRTQLFNKRAELRLLWVQTEPDAQKIKALQKEIHELRGQIQEKNTDFRLSLLNALTPEQRTQYLAQGLGKGPHQRRWQRHAGYGDSGPPR